MSHPKSSFLNPQFQDHFFSFNPNLHTRSLQNKEKRPVRVRRWGTNLLCWRKAPFGLAMLTLPNLISVISQLVFVCCVFYEGSVLFICESFLRKYGKTLLFLTWKKNMKICNHHSNRNRRPPRLTLVQTACGFTETELDCNSFIHSICCCEMKQPTMMCWVSAQAAVSVSQLWFNHNFVESRLFPQKSHSSLLQPHHQNLSAIFH